MRVPRLVLVHVFRFGSDRSARFLRLKRDSRAPEPAERDEDAAAREVREETVLVTRTRYEPRSHQDDSVE
jgi:8-oxo-dGTP pyrophosphatase MutT (NUDIX family)